MYYLNTILLRSRGARWLTRGEDRSDEAWRQIQWGEPLFRETYFVVLGTGRECSADPMVASASRSTIQNSQDAANASSGSSGVTKSTTAQHRTASDAEPSGAKASPPAGTVTKSPSSRPVRRCSSGVGTDAYTYPGRDQVKQIAGRTGLQSPTACLHVWEDSGSDFGYAMNVAHHGVDDLGLEPP